MDNSCFVFISNDRIVILKKGKYYIAPSLEKV